MDEGPELLPGRCDTCQTDKSRGRRRPRRPTSSARPIRRRRSCSDGVDAGGRGGTPSGALDPRGAALAHESGFGEPDVLVIVLIPRGVANDRDMRMKASIYILFCEKILANSDDGIRNQS